MVGINILEKEIENLKMDGSRIRASVPFPSGTIKEHKEFKENLMKQNLKYLCDLVPHVQKHLDSFGAVIGDVNMESPDYISPDEYKMKVNYQFLGKNVEKEFRALSKDEVYNPWKVVVDGLKAQFPNNTVVDVKEGQVIVR